MTLDLLCISTKKGYQVVFEYPKLCQETCCYHVLPKGKGIHWVLIHWHLPTFPQEWSVTLDFDTQNWVSKLWYPKLGKSLVSCPIMCQWCKTYCVFLQKWVFKVGSHDPIFSSNYSSAHFLRQQLDVWMPIFDKFPTFFMYWIKIEHVLFPSN